MCDDVAERLVVDVSSRVNGSEREGLIRLRVYKGFYIMILFIFKFLSWKIKDTNLLSCEFVSLVHQ